MKARKRTDEEYAGSNLEVQMIRIVTRGQHERGFMRISRSGHIEVKAEEYFGSFDIPESLAEIDRLMREVPAGVKA